jgi:hypothetical protein
MNWLSPKQLLPILLAATLAAGGWIQLQQARSFAKNHPLLNSDQIDALQQQVDQLSRENQELRALSQGGGEFAVPAEMITRIESQIGLKFRSPPLVHRLGSEQLRDRVEASQESRRGPGGLEDRQIAYQLIGWLGINDKLGAQIAALHATGSVCWFDEVGGDGWVTERFQQNSIPDQAALLRFLTRILLNQNFTAPFEDYQDDAIRARDALHSGVATGVETQFFQDAARSIGFLSLKGDNEANQLLLAVPPFVKGLAAFQSMEGKTYADSLLGKGRDALLAKMQNPPIRTAEIMYFSNPELPRKIAITTVPPGESVIDDSAGALGLRLWLEQEINGLEARKYAEKLMDDRWQLFATSERDFHLLWTLELADEESAVDLTKIFCARTAVLAESDKAMAIGKLVKTPAGRWLRVERIGKTTLRFVNTADQATADAVK